MITGSTIERENTNEEASTQREMTDADNDKTDSLSVLMIGGSSQHMSSVISGWRSNGINGC